MKTQVQEKREQILHVLDEIGRLNPSVRFGQLVVNISHAANGWTKSAAWDVEDEGFLEAARSYLNDLKRIDPQLLAGHVPAPPQEREKVAA